jgi:hypothetical protein
LYTVVVVWVVAVIDVAVVAVAVVVDLYVVVIMAAWPTASSLKAYVQ